MQRRITYAGFAVLALLIIAAVAVIIVRNRAEAKRTEELLAQWQRKGGALSQAAMKPEEIPNERNAAVLYEQSLDAIKKLTDEQRELLNDQQLNERSEALLMDLGSAIESAVEAGRRPQCAWARTQKSLEMTMQGTTIELPDLLSRSRPMRTYSHVVLLAARQAAARDDVQRAVELIIAARQMARHLMASGKTIDFLVGCGIDIKAWNAFEEIFRDRPLPDILSYELFTEPDEWQIRRRVVLYEGSYSLGRLQSLIDRGEASEDEVHYLARLLDRCLQAIHDQSWRATPMLPDVEDVPGDFETTRHFVRSNKLAFEGFELLGIENVAARMAVGARRHSETHGTYPDDWPQPFHPANSEPLFFTRQDDGFRIWIPERGPIWEW